MITDEEYRELKRTVEKQRRLADKAEGALAGLLKRLKEEFGYATEAEAARDLERLKAKLRKEEAALGAEYAAFVEEYGDRLGGD